MHVHTLRHHRSRAPQRPAVQPGALAFRAISAATGWPRQVNSYLSVLRSVCRRAGVLPRPAADSPVFRAQKQPCNSAR